MRSVALWHIGLQGCTWRNAQLSTSQNKTSPSSCTSQPAVSSSEGKASQTGQNLTKPGNPCSPLCTQEAPCEGSGIPGHLQIHSSKDCRLRESQDSQKGKLPLPLQQLWWFQALFHLFLPVTQNGNITTLTAVGYSWHCVFLLGMEKTKTAL